MVMGQVTKGSELLQFHYRFCDVGFVCRLC